ncbi:trypsin-like serine protease [Sorangium sp. So ce426]|uniref:trypsin-like serine protease n=1 Tax=Sorangium sp. So ce426 TaxID=3133312 RepID=UPI003F5AEBA7
MNSVSDDSATHFARTSIRAVSAVCASLMMMGCVGPEEEEAAFEDAVSEVDEEETAEAAAAINNGASSSWAAYTVKVGGCSGTLISPRWVLTANHCITGYTANGFKTSFGHGISSDYDITILPEGVVDPEDSRARVYKHTNAKSGDVLVMKKTQLQLGPFDSNYDASRDLALIKLDRRVPMSFVKPLHPYVGGTYMSGVKCPQSGDFLGKIVGFGGGSDLRRESIDGSYHRDTSPTGGDLYVKDWLLPIPVAIPLDFGMLPIVGTGAAASLGDYGGIEGGDSGGPLVTKFVWEYPDSYPGVLTSLCGVASGTYPTTRWDDIMCFLGGCWAIGQRHASVDSAPAQTFLKQATVIDKFGERVFEGECSAAPYSDKDFDCDGIVDECDSVIGPGCIVIHPL